ncbi:hypothetical protein [Acinetobacter rudis]|uniref:Lipoprotein n=1 Tax=Acinetobacter rudis CIP 110305 TaxID=421052 RepID=S3N3U0_9GAMM|nr:hypothetical protein [Acinetobacter rudis]EPF74660.1 hypothetical protein F945_01427 [Acinetobacter rudis CIP 110305]
MFLKNKLTIVLLTTLLLTACNDDSSEETSNADLQEPKVFEQWTSFRITEKSTDSGMDDSSLVTIMAGTKSTLTIDDNNLFENKELFNLEEKKQKLTPNYATTTGLFGSNQKHQQYGDHLGKIDISKTNQWVILPTLLNGNGKFIRKINYKVLDITGKNVLDTLDPDLSVRFNGIPAFSPIYSSVATELYKKMYINKFPEGSKCIQIASIEQNSDVLILEKYSEPNDSPYDQNTIKTWWENKKIEGEKISIFNSVEAFISDYSSSGAAKFNNTYYWAKQSSKGEFFSFATYVTNNKEALDDEADLSESGEKYSDIYEVLSKNSCHYFNPEAANFISELVKLKIST